MQVLAPSVIRSTTVRGCQPVTAPRSGTGTAAAREEQQGEPRGEVIETRMATEKHAGSGLCAGDVTK